MRDHCSFDHPKNHRVVHACEYLGHNDGTPNDVAAWDALVEAARPDSGMPINPLQTGKWIVFCEGLWSLHPGEVFRIPYAYRYRIRGEGYEASRLGSPLELEGMAATTIRDLGIETSGSMFAGLHIYGSYAPGAHPADRNQLINVAIITHGSVYQGALANQNSSDLLISGCRFLNYGTSPSPTLYSEGQSGIHVTGHTELHNFTPEGSVISLNNCGRFTMESGLVGGNPSVSATNVPQCGHTYIAIFGQCTEGLVFTGTKLYSEGQPAPYHGIWLADGAYLDGVVMGPEMLVDTQSTFWGGDGTRGPNIDIRARRAGNPG